MSTARQKNEARDRLVARESAKTFAIMSRKLKKILGKGVIAEEATQFSGDNAVMLKLSSSTTGSVKYHITTPKLDRRKADLAETAAEEAKEQRYTPAKPFDIFVTEKNQPLWRDQSVFLSQHKPFFLQELEMYMEREILKCAPESAAGDVHREHLLDNRLQVVNEVFSAIIRQCPEYRTLLSGIKRHYDEMINFRDVRIKALEANKRLLAAAEEEFDNKCRTLRRSDAAMITQLEMEKFTLLRRLDTTNEEKDVLKAALAKVQGELSKEHGKFRDEEDARRLLIVDVNDLKSQVRSLTKQTMAKTESGEVQEDPVLLRMQLNKAKTQLQELQKELALMKATYTDVIPRREFDIANLKLEQLKADFASVDDRFEKMNTEFREVIGKCECLQEELYEVQKENKALRGSSTPRPDWLRCSEVIKGGMAYWLQMARGKNSEQKVGLLVKELTGSSFEQGPDKFRGKGTDESVPPYLRYDGDVKNRRLSRKEAATTVYDIWRRRRESFVDNQPVQPLDEFLQLYLNSRFPIAGIRAEWAYSLTEASERMGYDERLAMFGGILTGHLEEGVVHALFDDMAMIDEACRKKATEMGIYHPDEGYTLTQDVVQQIISRVFQLKKQPAIQALMDAARCDLNIRESGEMQVKKVFHPTEEGYMGLFFMELTQQARDEQNSYVRELFMAMGVSEGTPPKAGTEEQKSAEEGSDDTNVGMSDLRNALMTVDPYIPEDVANRYLLWTFKATQEDLELEDSGIITVPASLLAARLRSGNIRRYGPSG